MKRALLAAAVLMLSFVAVSAKAQTTYNDVWMSINIGDSSHVTFAFGHPPDGTAGTTELIIQCDLYAGPNSTTPGRAELITNFGVYGQMQSSGMFPLVCAPPQTYGYGNCSSAECSLTNTPLSQSLVLTGQDYYGNKTSTIVNLTINSATWRMIGGGRWAKDTGSAEIVY